MSAQDLLITVNGGVDPATAPQIVPSFDFATPIGVGTWMMSDLVLGTDTLTIEVTNIGETPLKGVGLWIALATVPGAHDVRNHNPPQSDFVDLLFLGDKAAAAGGPIVVGHSQDLNALTTYESGGLWVSEPHEGSPSNWYRVTSQRGRSMATRIGNATLQAEGANVLAWEIVLDDPGTGAVRFYYDIMVENGVVPDAS